MPFAAFAWVFKKHVLSTFNYILYGVRECQTRHEPRHHEDIKTPTNVVQKRWWQNKRQFEGLKKQAVKCVGLDHESSFWQSTPVGLIHVTCSTLNNHLSNAPSEFGGLTNQFLNSAPVVTAPPPPRHLAAAVGLCVFS